MPMSPNRLSAVMLFVSAALVSPAFGQQLVSPAPTVSVSSQNASTGQLGIKAIDGIIGGFPGNPTVEWATMGQLAGAWIQFSWSSPVQVSEIVLWDRPNSSDNVKAGTLSFSDGSTASVGQLPNDASSGYTVSFPTKSISWVKFTVTQAVGFNIGLAECQIFAPSTGTVSARSVSLAPASVVGGNASQGTVTLSGPAPSGAVVTLLSSDTAAATVPSSVTVSQNATSATFTVSTSNVSSSTSSTISASYGGSSPNAVLTVLPQSASGDIALTATVTDSSENASTGQLGIKAIDGVIGGFPGDPTKEWATLGQLAGAWIQLSWSSPQQVGQVVLWDRPNTSDNVQAGTLSFSDGTTLPVGTLPNDASSGYTVNFSAKSITSVKFTVTQAVGSNIGLAEFQVFAPSSGGGVPITGRTNFLKFVIDQNPPPTTLEKGLADIDGDGRLDAIIGFGNPNGTTTGVGLAWYEFPHSGNAGDAWLKHTILASGVMYEELRPLDVNGDGAVDVIASEVSSWPNTNIYWFENPRGHGGNPATDPWLVHFIGTSSGETNMALGDIDGDGKTDLITNTAIYFQNTPTSWTQVNLNRTSNGVALLDIGSGLGSVNIVGMGQSPFPIVWLENPREHGGNARTDPWITHVIGPGYDQNGLAVTYATADFNGDGRMDVATAVSETCTTFPVLWWEAPADRRNGTWIKHTIDSTYQCVHNLRTGDVDKDGFMDIVAAEQEQSAQKRLTIFYGDGLGGFTPQILSTQGGHEQVLSDVENDSDLDILNANHGWTGFPHPIEIYINGR
jgi:hypothetical protein